MKPTQKTLLTVLAVAAAAGGLWYMSRNNSGVPQIANDQDKINVLNTWSGGSAPAWTKKAVSAAIALGSSGLDKLYVLITKAWSGVDGIDPYDIDQNLNKVPRNQSLGAWWESFVAQNKLY